jgi:hypothetical protein
MKVFRTFTYSGKELQLATYEPEALIKPRPSPLIGAPGAGKFEIGPVRLSAAKISPGETCTLTAQVTGKNIAFIYTEVLFHDQGLNQLYGPVMREYLQAERNKVIGGVSHPAWDPAISVTVRLSPGLRLLTDGTASAFGFLLPESYTSPAYRLDGLYTPAGGSTPRRARLSFDRAGHATQVVVYKDPRGRTAPHAGAPKPGDQFTPFVQILTPPGDMNLTWQVTTGLSTPLTWRAQPLCWTTEPPLPGDYLVGLLVQDLDGNLTRQYAPLRVVP